MAIQHLHAFLVHPNKKATSNQLINGAPLALKGRLFGLLNSIYIRSDEECNIDISFTTSASGIQQNDCRDLFIEYLQHTTLENGRKIAHRLEQNTDGRSGLGLLFLIVGKEGNEHKLVISRFPTDIAILADEESSGFKLEFLERVFIKNRISYKSVAYRDNSLHAGFWSGRATDRQLGNRSGELSNYWIRDFLSSQLTDTAAAGTRRLAVAMREAGRNSGLDVKREINAAATLANGLAGVATSINDFGDRYALTQAAKEAISNELKTPELAGRTFTFDVDEFRSVIAFKSVELDNGGVLTAPSGTFDDVFREEVLEEEEKKIRFVTEGEIVNEKLKAKA